MRKKENKSPFYSFKEFFFKFIYLWFDLLLDPEPAGKTQNFHLEKLLITPEN